jgi:hypothetical protein
MLPAYSRLQPRKSVSLRYGESSDHVSRLAVSLEFFPCHAARDFFDVDGGESACVALAYGLRQ